MQSIIDFLFFDSSWIHEKIKQNKEYKKLDNKCYDTYNKLRETLTEEQQEQLEDIIWSKSGLECSSNETYFKAGLKIGLRLFAEDISEIEF